MEGGVLQCVLPDEGLTDRHYNQSFAMDALSTPRAIEM